MVMETSVPLTLMDDNERKLDTKCFYWINLPMELWLNIFKLLPQTTLIFVVRHVCKYFRQLAFDPILWKAIDMNSWKATTTAELLTQNTNLAQPAYNDDLNTILDYLSLNEEQTSSKIFIAIAKSIYHILSKVTFSRYENDFLFGLEEQCALFKCSNLLYFDASFCNEITSNTLKALSSNCVKLKTVILEGCSNVTDEAMKSLSSLHGLEILNICHCAGVTDEGLAHIMLMHAKLKELYCDGIMHITDVGLLPFSQYQSSIRALSLDGEHLHDISIVSVLTHLPHLDSFEVSFCSNLTDITFASILRCENHRFRRLHLRKLSNSISSGLVTELFEHVNMELLRELSLTDCLAVSDDTLRSISTTCLMLEQIHLDWCVSVTDEGVSMLVNHCRELKKLVLVGLKRLLGSWLPGLDLPHLTLLDLTQCDLVSDDELRRLVQRFPQITAYNYYHEHVAPDVVESSQSPSPSSAQEAPCPASRGAFVDF